jgi:Glu-tRNA(Gln) amidotransferase subunit E-like FAD-binding protein
MEITGEYANDPYDAITSLEEEGSEESLDLMERIKYVEEEIDQIEAEMYFDEEESDNVEENYKSTKKVIKLTENDLTRIVKKVIKEQRG